MHPHDVGTGALRAEWPAPIIAGAALKGKILGQGTVSMDAPDNSARAAIERIAVAITIGTIAAAATILAAGRPPGRTRWLLAGSVIGFALAVAAGVVQRYRALRAGPRTERVSVVCDILLIVGVLVGLAAGACAIVITLLLEPDRVTYPHH